MKKYKCKYENGENLNIQNWQKEIEAIGAQEAYDKFIGSVGTQQEKILVFEPNVKQGGFYDPDIFEGHIEKKNEVEDEDNTVIHDQKYLLMQEMNTRLSSISGMQIEQIDKLSKIRWAAVAIAILTIIQTFVLTGTFLF
jgi:hypothetical protein